MLLLIVMFRLSPPVMNAVMDTDFIQSFTFLDRDHLTLKGTGKDLFVAVQPHHILGTVFSSVLDGSTTRDLRRHSPGDRFVVRDADIILNYTYRGGAVVDIWMLPQNMCSDVNIFSTQQRSAKIHVSEVFDRDTQLCWFLKFRRNVTWRATVQSGAKAMIADNCTLRDPVQIQEGSRMSGTAGAMHVIALHAKAHERVEFTAIINSTCPFGDWTDSPSRFHDRGDPPLAEPCYIETDRSVANWIWAVLASVFVGIFGFTVVIFFIKPIHKLGVSISNSDEYLKSKSD